jgi:hypothetical protein
VRVVDRQHHRLALREVGAQPVAPVNRRAKLDRCRSEAEWTLRQAGRTVENGIAIVRPERGDHRCQEIADDRESPAALELDRSGRQHEHSRSCSHLTAGLQQRGLADARRAFDHKRGAVPRPRLGDRVPQPTQLDFAFDQRHGSPRSLPLEGILGPKPFGGLHNVEVLVFAGESMTTRPSGALLGGV